MESEMIFYKTMKKILSNLFSTWEKCVSLNCGNFCRTTHILWHPHAQLCSEKFHFCRVSRYTHWFFSAGWNTEFFFKNYTFYFSRNILQSEPNVASGTPYRLNSLLGKFDEDFPLRKTGENFKNCLKFRIFFLFCFLKSCCTILTSSDSYLKI